MSNRKGSRQPVIRAFCLSPIACLLMTASGCANLQQTTSEPTAAEAQASDPVTSQPHVELQGQLSIKLGAHGEQTAQGLSLGFFFSGNAQTGQLDLMTLMGSQMAQIAWVPGRSILTDSKGSRTFADLDALSQEILAEALPLHALVHWMQGHADPSLPSQIDTESGTFLQAGWQIDTRQLSQKKLQAQRPDSPTQRAVQIKVYLDR